MPESEKCFQQTPVAEKGYPGFFYGLVIERLIMELGAGMMLVSAPHLPAV